LKRWALGSIAQKLTRHSSIPLLVLHEKSDRPSHLAAEHPQVVQILVALDGSPLAERVLAPAVHLGVALSVPEQTTLHLVQVLPFPATHGLLGIPQGSAAAREHIIADTHVYLEGVKKNVLTGSLAFRNLAVTTSVLVQDDVAEALVNMANAEEKRAEKPETVESMEIIALTTHGRSGLQRWALGSITERVLDSTRQPVLIVHADSSQLS
jgi:nucleotide-binding universal stress UspA family protein